MSSSEEVVFQNNVLVRHILQHLMHGPVNLLHLALINKKFYQEVCSCLRQIKHLNFYSDGPSSTECDEEAEHHQHQDVSQNVGFNELISDDSSTFHSNLSFVTNQSPIISADFQHFHDSDAFKLGSLLRLKGIESLVFNPSQRNTCNEIYLSLIDRSVRSLRKLVNPPENFFKSLVHDTCLNLDFLEMDISIFRAMYHGIRSGEDVYLFQVKEEFEDILKNKFKVKSLTLHGHNRVRFQPYHETVIADSNVSSVKMVCDEPTVTSDDLTLFQEWKNRNRRFLQIRDFELIFWNDILKSDYATAISTLLDIFPSISRLTFGYQGFCSDDDCIEIIDSVQQYWKKSNFPICQHYVNVTVVIPKEKLNNFELRLINHKSYQSLIKTCKIWCFQMRINISDNILFAFSFL